VWDLIFWRFVGGLGIGMASVIAPAYSAEISPAYGVYAGFAVVSFVFVAKAVRETKGLELESMME